MLKKGWGSWEGTPRAEAETLVQEEVAVVEEAWIEEGEVKVIRSASIQIYFDDRGDEFADGFDVGYEGKTINFSTQAIGKLELLFIKMWKTAGNQVWEEDQEFGLSPGDF